MALPNQLRNSMLPTELEFVASEELIEIIPTCKMDRIQLISGRYGPFVGGRKTIAPLWLAINLKLKKKCNIISPAWLSVEALQERLTEETDERFKDGFTTVPFRYASVAKVLLDVAPDDIAQPDKIRKLLKDICEARQSKIRDSLFQLNPSALKMTGVCAMELNEIRPFFSKAMGTLIQLKTENTDIVQDGGEAGVEYA